MNLLSRIFSKGPRPSDSVTVGFQKVLSNARSIADKHYNSYVGSQYIFLGILWLQDGIAIDALKRSDIEIERIREDVANELSTEVVKQRSQSIPYTPVVKKIIRKAEKEAIALGHQSLGPEHLLLGFLEVRNSLSQKLADAGLTSTPLRHTIRELKKRSEQVGPHNSGDCAPSS